MSLQELGPRFTLKLLWLKDSVIDSELPEYEWTYKVCMLNYDRIEMCVRMIIRLNNVLYLIIYY